MVTHVLSDTYRSAINVENDVSEFSDNPAVSGGVLEILDMRLPNVNVVSVYKFPSISTLSLPLRPTPLYT